MKIGNYKFILCSSSPRRLEILKQIGFNPLVEKSNFKEDLNKSEYADPIDYVRDTSYYKLVDVCENTSHDGPLLFLSADTVIISGDKILEKPNNFENNVKMLKTLRESQNNGEIIKIVTCCTLCKVIEGVKDIKKFDSITEIKLVDDITDEFIIEYCKSGEGLEVAGGFKIQGFGAILFKEIRGDYYNCVGLPASLVYGEIKNMLKG